MQENNGCFSPHQLILPKSNFLNILAKHPKFFPEFYEILEGSPFIIARSFDVVLYGKLGVYDPASKLVRINLFVFRLGTGFVFGDLFPEFSIFQVNSLYLFSQGLLLELTFTGSVDSLSM